MIPTVLSLRSTAASWPHAQSSQTNTTRAPYPFVVERSLTLLTSVIPHVFGRNKPPVISEHTRLKKELDLVDALGDMVCLSRASFRN